MKNWHFSSMLLSIGLVVCLSGCPLLMSVRVPDVVGMTQLAAEAAVSGRSLTVGTVTASFHPSAPAGEVTGQSPAAGAVVEYGSAVDLTVSKGPASVTVPDVVGMTEAEAEEALVGAGLTVGTVTESFHPSAPAGEVIGQSPAAGTVVDPGSAVDLTVSKGPEPVTVPDVVGMTEAAAGVEIVAAGLAVGTVTEAYHPNAPVGEVTGQNPVSGTLVAPVSAVDLTVSKGPEPVAVPDVVGMTQAAAEADIVAAGLAVGTVTDEYHPTAPVGEVLAQDPVSGTMVLPGSAVDLTVSKGPAPVPVPDVVGMSPVDAAAALVTAGFVTGTPVEQYHHTIVAGLICRQEPGAGVLADLGSTVDLGLSRGPYITTIEELQKIGNDPDYPLNASYYLMNDIDASATETWNGGEGFVPLGSNEVRFTGVLDGVGYSITGLHINLPEFSGTNVGLFNYADGGFEIRNLSLVDADVTGYGGVGALLGYAEYGTISDCHVAGNVTGWGATGGLVGGVRYGTINDCSSDAQVSAVQNVGGLTGLIGGGTSVSGCQVTGDVTGTMYVGGLIGEAESGTVTGCSTHVGILDMEEPANYLAGLIGLNSATVSECHTTTTITVFNPNGSNCIGGLIGRNNGAVSKCYANSSVSVQTDVSAFFVSYAGGLVGLNNIGATLTECYAVTSVTNRSYTGGLVGLNAGNIDQCYALGAVTGTDYVGGLVGHHQIGTISECYYAIGPVTGTTHTGGLVGKSDDTVETSFWDTQTSGQAASEGGTGKTTAEMNAQATFTGAGWDFTTVWTIQEGVTYPYFIWD